MKTVIVLEDPFFIPFVEQFLSGTDNLLVVEREVKTALKSVQATGFDVLVGEDLTDKHLYHRMSIEDGDRFVLCCATSEKCKKGLDVLLSIREDITVVVLEREKQGIEKIKRFKDVFFITIADLVGESLDCVVKKYENRKKVKALHAISRDAENVLILLQNDPDPDAIAGGLALRVLMGRNKQTAPLATFGEVTRSENLSMIKLLDIPIVQITRECLEQYARIAMVDVQPPYFKDYDIQADIVIDHHPRQEKYHAAYEDIRVPYGATATILAEYLIHAEYKITQRLATALLYGIKTDTMFLERGISQADILAFTYLYPIANINMLRQIEKPNLEYGEINAFVKALKHADLTDGMLFSYLGTVDAEDIIPRLADFCLQIGSAEWAVVSGIYNRKLVCCVRNVGYVKHAGELVSRAFGEIGSAGGHRYMAKAVVPVAVFKRATGIASRKECASKIKELLLGARE